MQLPAWVIVTTADDAEETAERNLRRAGYRVYLPRYRKLMWPHGSERRGTPTMRPLFPGYLFAHDWQGWPQHRLGGVASIMRSPEGRNVEMVDADVMLLWDRERSGRFDDARAPGPAAKGKRPDLSVGDKVEFDLIEDRVSGEVEDLTDSGQAIIKMMMFNRETRVTVAAETLRALSG